jgi:hypothetical protein
MTDPLAYPDSTPPDLLARQNAVIEDLTRTVELQKQQLEALRRRFAALEGVPWASQEPPD